MGMAYKALTNYDKAIEALKNAIKLEPSNPNANGLQIEITKCENLDNDKEKKRLEKLAKAMQNM